MRYLPEIGNDLLVDWQSSDSISEGAESLILVSDSNSKSLHANVAVNLKTRKIVAIQIFKLEQHKVKPTIGRLTSSDFTDSGDFKSLAPYFNDKEQFLYICKMDSKQSRESMLYLTCIEGSYFVVLFKAGIVQYYDSGVYETPDELNYLVAAVKEVYLSKEKVILNLELDTDVKYEVFNFSNKYFGNVKLLEKNLVRFCSSLDTDKLVIFNSALIEKYIDFVCA